MKLFSLLILSVLLAYPAMAQETLPMSSAVSASEAKTEARSLYEAGDAAFEKDQFEDAFALFQKSADLGYAPARYMLAECYVSGRGVKEDRIKAAELWTNALDPVRKAAEAGDAYAMYLVGDYILKKEGGGLNTSMPWIEDNNYGTWFQRAADRGYVKAAFRLSDIRSSSASSAAARSFYLDVNGYRRTAGVGYAPAQYVMGRLYETGSGVEKDPVESLNWYRRAAEGGWPRAMYRIGVYYAEGKVVEKDAAEAAKWYRKAADAGYPQAQYMYGRCLEKGEGVEKDVVEAVKWYRKAAEQDLPAARSMLASCYANGRGVGYDIREAAKWNIEPWYVGSSDRNYHLYVEKRATRHLDPAEYEDYDNGLDASMIYYAADMTGDPRANNPAPKLQLGDSYFYGRNGLEQNYAEAAKWYRKATEAIVGRGFYEMGFCYEYGKGVEADLEEAEKWYRKAADARQEQFNVENRTKIRQLVREARDGNAESAYQAGLAFASGTGVKQDMPEALKWFRKAAEQGYAGAQFELGKCYETGTGVPQDNANALRWYQAAAEQGYAPARNVLSRCYREGLLGVKQDPDAALYWETGSDISSEQDALREFGFTD